MAELKCKIWQVLKLLNEICVKYFLTFQFDTYVIIISNRNTEKMSYVFHVKLQIIKSLPFSI